jgi:hypothetical protein
VHNLKRKAVGVAVAVLIGGAGILAAAGTASASTAGCTSLGTKCGTEINFYGNGWDAKGNSAAYDTPVLASPNGNNAGQDFYRLPSGSGFRFELAENGNPTGMCISNPMGGGGVPKGSTGLVLRACNGTAFQQFTEGTTGAHGTQLISAANGQLASPNGTGAQLSTYAVNTAVGSYWSWAGGASKVTSATATTSLTNDPDSGDNGNWATDTITRTVTVSLHGAAAPSDCGTGNTAPCYLYSATLKDKGTFAVANGAPSPKAGTAVKGPVAGDLTGSASYSFYASAAKPDASSVPSTVDESQPSAPSTGSWYKQFFPSTTQFGGTGMLDTWSWSYTTTSTCVSPAQTWVDAASNGAGVNSTGDITGAAACVPAS